MEHLMQWIIALNRYHHTEYAILTVLTMVGVGTVLASAIELLFILVGIRYQRNPDPISEK